MLVGKSWRWKGYTIRFRLLCIWRTALNLLVAQTPRCELWKRRGLCPSCLSHEDKTCIFRTLLVLWKGHRLVWNIKQLMLSEIKRILEESGKPQKKLWWYISLNLQQIWQNEKIKTWEQRASERSVAEVILLLSEFCICIYHYSSIRVLLLKCQDFWLKRQSVWERQK